MIRQTETVDLAREANSPREKENLSYHAVHATARKPAFKLLRGQLKDTFYWAELMRVAYNPTPGDKPGELLTLRFHAYEVAVRGRRLGIVERDFQEQLVDFIRVSSRQEQMGAGPANEPVIESIDLSEIK